MIVVDASALARVLAEKSDEAARLRVRLRGQALAAPSLIDAEVLSVLRGLALGGKLPVPRARAAVTLLVRMPVQRVPMRRLLVRAWELRERCSAYDAMYLALAERLGCPLVTSDGRLACSRAATCPVELFA